MKILYTLFFLILTAGILTNSQISLYYGLTGLKLWFDNMIPGLLPFMILSGIMIRMGLTEGFCTLAYPLISPLWRVRKNVCYAMLMGFLCGFPMGARVTADLLEQKLITKKEGEFLLSFCNNIGPVYFCSFVLPLLNRRLVWPYLFGMYGIPLLYGLILRYTKYRTLSWNHSRVKLLGEGDSLLKAVDFSVRAAMESILSLGGYMIFFNLLNLLPHLITGKQPKIIAPLLEITGGLRLLGDQRPLYSLLALSFGGLSCIAQTYNCISGTGLSVKEYFSHKLMVTACCAAYYFLWFCFWPETFLC